MYEFRTNNFSTDDGSNWEACDVVCLSDKVCTVISRRDGRLDFVKRDNVRLRGSTSKKKRKREEISKKRRRSNNKENDSSDLQSLKKWKPWIGERVFARKYATSKSYYGATVQELNKKTASYSIQFDDGTWNDNITLHHLQTMKPSEVCQYKVSCGAGHFLTAFKTDRKRKCSACMGWIPRNTIGYECITCDHHKCQKCCAISIKRCYDSKTKKMKKQSKGPVPIECNQAARSSSLPLRVLYHDNV